MHASRTRGIQVRLIFRSALLPVEATLYQSTYTPNIMKIEIEFTSSYSADITIDGKQMKYCLIGQKTGLTGIEPELLEDSIGGIVALKITGVLTSILQGWMPDEQNADDCCWGTWDKLTESASEEVTEAINPWG